MNTHLPDQAVWPLTDLHEWEGNARQGDVDVIKESMRTNGVFQPIVVQASTGKIIAGNHRYKALVELHREAPDSWPDEVTVLPLDVTDEEAARIHVADNKTSDDAEWDYALLVAQLEELDKSETGLLGTGFDEDQLNDLRAMFTKDDLDDLAEEFGDPDEDDLWGSFSVKAPNDLVQRAEDALDSYDGDTPAERLKQLLDSHPNHEQA